MNKKNSIEFFFYFFESIVDIYYPLAYLVKQADVFRQASLASSRSCQTLDLIFVDSQKEKPYEKQSGWLV